jgi:hypothetical protein
MSRSLLHVARSRRHRRDPTDRLGRDHTLAVTRTGALWAWGLNNVGQLGDQTTTTRLAPVIIDGIDDAVEAHGGRGYTVVRGNTA